MEIFRLNRPGAPHSLRGRLTSPSLSSGGVDGSVGVGAGVDVGVGESGLNSTSNGLFASNSSIV